jgi:hypothetical protein
MTVRAALLDLHRALVAEERREHEKTLGRLTGGDDVPDTDVLAAARARCYWAGTIRNSAGAAWCSPSAALTSPLPTPLPGGRYHRDM